MMFESLFRAAAAPRVSTRRRALVRRHRPAFDPLEGRALLAIGFTSAFGVGGTSPLVERVAIDTQGNTYITGSFSGKVGFDPNSTGSNVLDAGNLTNAFVAKYSPSNTLVWVKQFAADPATPGSTAEGRGVAVDSNTGAVYVTGSFTGKVDFDPGGNILNLTSAGGDDGFVVKLTANGDLDSGLARRFGGAGDDDPNTVTLDKTGANLYIAGTFTGVSDFDPGGTDTSLTSKDITKPDGFVLKLSSELGFGFVAQAGLANSGASDAVADSQGNVYLVGAQNVPSGDAFVAKFNGAGVLATETLFGGPASGGTGAEALSVAVDSSNNAYVTGEFKGTGVEFNKFNGPGTMTLDSLGGADAFVIKIDPAGDLLFARRFGSTGDDDGVGLAIDPSNHVFVTGAESGPSTFGTTGVGTPVLITRNGGTSTPNAFVLETDSGGNFIQAVGATGPGSISLAISVNASDQIAIAGFYAAGASFATTSLPAVGMGQIFVARLSPSNGGGGNGGVGVSNPPTFVSETRLTTGKGKKKKLSGFELNFNSALNTTNAQDVSHYHVTQQQGQGKKSKPKTIAVKSATPGPGGTSVTLTLASFQTNKPLQLTATGLTGANGATLANVITKL
jgi:hypothetical protein